MQLQNRYFLNTPFNLNYHYTDSMSQLRNTLGNQRKNHAQSARAVEYIDCILAEE